MTGLHGVSRSARLDQSNNEVQVTIKNIAIFAALLCVGVAGRVLPHDPNFTPVAAAALFAGFLFPRRLASLALPLATMAISDLFIGSYDARIMAAVYFGLMLPVFLGGLVRGRFRPLRVIIGAALSSFAFFVVSNFAVWCWSGIYDRSVAGLVDCYALAVPFLKNSLEGDLFWSSTLFGVYYIGSVLVSHRRRMSTPALA
jgi:hypothetical protein